MNEAKNFSSHDAIAQQAAYYDAATLLAQTHMPSLQNVVNPLYTNLLSTSLAQQQLATAQVLANLRASVSGFKPLKSMYLLENWGKKRVKSTADVPVNLFFRL